MLIINLLIRLPAFLGLYLLVCLILGVQDYFNVFDGVFNLAAGFGFTTRQTATAMVIWSIVALVLTLRDLFKK